MKIEIHIKQIHAYIEVPKGKTIKWIIEAALLWHQELKKNKFHNEKCIAKRGNG